MIGIQVGDDVVVSKGVWWGDQYSMGRVSRVTPSGQVVLENGERYKPDGRRVGGSGSIQPATDEARGRVRRQKLQQELRKRLESALDEIHWMDLGKLERLDEALALRPEDEELRTRAGAANEDS